MSIHWEPLFEKKQRLKQPAPSNVELQEMEKQAADLLMVPQEKRNELWATSLGYGMRTRALISVHDGVPHRFAENFPRVVVKLFKGPAADYRRFHLDCFRRLPMLQGNTSFQQSLEAGALESRNAYAILEYVEGKTLRETLETSDVTWTKQRSLNVLRCLMDSIWIPCWTGSLRFKDCHKGNFIVDPNDLHLVMIDVEQTRKSAFELLDRPDDWKDRNRHEKSALRQLPGLIVDLLAASNQGATKAGLRRTTDQALKESELPEALRALGRAESDSDVQSRQAQAAVVSLYRYLGEYA
jgi:hypothetical protein